jgi:hypothetical protein
MLRHVVAAAAVVLAAARGPEPALDRPSISSIVVRRDTIWFCGGVVVRESGRSPVTFAYVRATRTWTPALKAPTSVCPDSRANVGIEDTMALGGGVTA